MVPVIIHPNYITRIVMISAPQYTLYTRPTAKALVGVSQTECKCQLCGRRHRNGTQWCIGGCWMPLTWAAVQKRSQCVSQSSDAQARRKEIEAIYGISMKTLH